MAGPSHEFVLSFKDVCAIIVSTITVVGTLIAYLHKILHQLKPNSGGSLRDGLDRIEKKIDRVDFAQHIYFDNVPAIPMFTTDGEGRCDWANKAYIDLVDRPLQEILNNNWSIVVHQDDREKVENEWKQACAQNRNFDMVYRYSNGDVLVHCKAWGSQKTGYVGLVFVKKDESKINLVQPPTP